MIGESKYTFINDRLTKSEFRESIGSLLESMRQTTDKLPETEKKDRKKKAEKDFFYFAKTYFPHYCTLPFAPMHYDIFKTIMTRDSLVLKPKVILGPREFAKSVIFRLIFGAWQVAFKKVHFGAYCAANIDMAQDFLFYLALEFAENRRLIQDFGELCPRNYQGDDVIFNNNIKWIALSRGAATKGLLHGPYRLECAIIDDLQKIEEERSVKQTAQAIAWIEQDLYSAIVKTGWLIILGNNSERNCAMDKLKRNYAERWTVRVYTPYADKAKTISAWPEKLSFEEIEEKKHIMGIKAFSGQMMQEPLSASNAFQEHHVIRKDPEKSYVGYYHAFDPAIGTDESSCSKAHAVVGVTDDAYYDVVYSWIRKESIAKALEQLFVINQLFESVNETFESNGGQKFLLLEIANMEKEKGIRLSIKDKNSSDNKRARIESLGPLVERGVLRFCPGSDNEKLIELLLAYPNDELDGPDALAMAVKAVRKSSQKAKARAG